MAAPQKGITSALALGLLVALSADGGHSLAENRDLPTRAREAEAPRVLPGFTAAYRHAVLATLQPGRLSQILVEEGRAVAEGDLLARLDSRVQAARTEIARLEAESTIKVELTRVQMEHARAELDRIKRLSAATAAADSEARQAQLAFDTACLAHRQAEQEHTQAIENHRLQQELLAQYELRAPFSGLVTNRLKEAGETVEELEGVLELSQVDVLLVTADCPLELHGLVRLGDRLAVMPKQGNGMAKTGEVISCMPVADPSSQTFKLKLLVPNQDGAWIAGLLVNIDLDNRIDGAVGISTSSQPAAASVRR